MSKEQGDDGEKEGAQASLACDNDVEPPLVFPVTRR